ncbi:MAG: threonylcarbamoyl-AMP synthase [Alphaproteobacteria bacterium]|nr:threonylcarbamoyl-AMP synthase [Alphaproteobacteria bacterium]
MIKTANNEAIAGAAEIIKSGGLVAMPTETVYGLAGNARDGAAVAKIYEAKGRPAFNPLIVHVGSAKDAGEIAEMSAQAHAVATAFWPGPLTLVLPRKADSGISELATAGLETVAVRVPGHKTARALIEAAGVPLVAPSANKSGSLSPTTPAHVADSLGDSVDMILADGACAVGLESTVLDLSGDVPVVLRPGAITAEDISHVLGIEVGYAAESGEPDAPKAPGMLLKHYAPETPVRLNAVDLESGEVLLAFGSIRFMGIKGGGAAADLPDSQIRNLSEEGDLHEAAANLFAMMKALDQPAHTRIAVMNIPEVGLGIAINDRLRRAAEAG